MSSFRTVSRLNFLFATAAFTTVAAGIAFADPAPLTPLDWLPTGQSQESLLGISGDGSIAVGYARTLSNQIHAVSWSGATGGITDLGFVGNSYAYGISGDGGTIVGVLSGGPSRGFAIQNNSTTYLAPGLAGQNAYAYAVNFDGSFIAGDTVFLGFDGNSHAARWSGAGWGTVTDLGVLPGGDYSSATGISGDGSIVVGYSDTGAHYHAFYWNGTLHDLGSLFGDNGSSYAKAISSDGTTIVGQSDLAFGQTAAAWTGVNYATIRDLGTLGGNSGQANAVNTTGSVIVGWATLADNSTSHAFRWENGVMADLNTLLTDAGVDMTGIVLETATAVSGHSDYIGANDGVGGKAYVVFYESDGSAPPIGGLTTQGDQQNAAAELVEAQQGAAVQGQGFGGRLLGADDALGAPDGVGAFGAVGSVSAGVAGKVALGRNVSLLGGISYVKESYKNVDMNRAVMAALALRYVFDEAGAAHPFVETGGWIAPNSSFTFRRPYANGGGTATGVGDADGTLGYAYAKAGLGYDVTASDEAVIATEIGYSRFTTDAYDEPLTLSNPFNAHVSSGTNRLGVVKLQGKWTHDFSPKIDGMLRLAGAHGFAAASDVTTTVAGFGTLAARNPENPSWIEYGARAGYRISEGAKVSLFVNGVAGQKSVHSEAHTGIELNFDL